MPRREEEINTQERKKYQLKGWNIAKRKYSGERKKYTREKKKYQQKGRNTHEDEIPTREKEIPGEKIEYPGGRNTQKRVVVVVVVTWCFTPSQPLRLYQGETYSVIIQ